MPDIDSLSINITSSSKPAVKAINEIIDSLKGLNTALSNPQQLTGADKLAKELSGISTAVNSIDANKIKNLANVLTTLSVAGTKLSKSGVSEGLKKIGVEAKTASTSTTKFQFSTNALSKTLGNMSNPLKLMRHNFTSLASVIGHLYANFFLLIRGAKALGRAMDYSSSMTEAANVVSVAFGKQSDKMNEFANTAIKDFGLAKLAATEYASRFQTMGKTMGITANQIVAANDFITKKISGNSNAYSKLGDSVADMSINLTKLTADMASLYNQDYADVAQDMQAIFTGMTRPLRKYGLDLTQATLKEWALANGLDADIEKMSQAEKTMLRYQYVMSRTSGAMGDFAKTADTWANAMRTVKQLLQEIARLIGEALINALRPALLAFRDFLFKFLKMTESALNALGKLLGWKQISFAAASIIDDTEDYADALDDATGAAKKLKGQLRGIDELNNLTSNNKGGSGAGGLGGIAADIETMLEEIEDEEKPYESAIKSWYEFGQKVANAIKNGLANIDWNTIKEKGRAFATNFASWLNGFIQPDMFFQVGSTVGEAIMTAIESFIAFEDEAQFDKWGASIAAAINGFFDKFKGDKAAEAVNKLKDGLESLFKNAFENIHWNEVFKDIKDFALSLEPDTIDFVFTAAAAATAAASIGAALTAAFMSNPIIVTVALAVGSVGFLAGKGIDKLFTKALGKNDVTGNDRYEEMWTEFFDSMYRRPKLAIDLFKQEWGSAGNYADMYGESRLKSYLNVPYWAGEKLSEQEFEGTKTPYEYYFKKIKESFLTDEINEQIEKVNELKNAWNNYLETFSKLGNETGVKIRAWWDEDISPWFTLEKWTDLFGNIKEALKNVWNEAVEFWKATITNWWNNDVAPWFTPEKWKEILQPIRDQFKYAFQAGANSAVGALNKVLGGIEKMVNGASDIINLLIEVASKISGKDISKLSKLSIPRIATPYANGGYPQVGSLFLAGEAGSEMVGTINGRTGVVSNGEITGIADAIRSTSDTEIQLLRQQNALLQGILNKEFGITKDNVFRSVRESAREYSNMTGRPAFT